MDTELGTALGKRLGLRLGIGLGILLDIAFGDEHDGSGYSNGIHYSLMNRTCYGAGYGSGYSLR